MVGPYSRESKDPLQNAAVLDQFAEICHRISKETGTPVDYLWPEHLRPHSGLEKPVASATQIDVAESCCAAESTTSSSGEAEEAQDPPRSNETRASEGLGEEVAAFEESRAPAPELAHTPDPPSPLQSEKGGGLIHENEKPAAAEEGGCGLQGLGNASVLHDNNEDVEAPHPSKEDRPPSRNEVPGDQLESESLAPSPCLSPPQESEEIAVVGDDDLTYSDDEEKGKSGARLDKESFLLEAAAAAACALFPSPPRSRTHVNDNEPADFLETDDASVGEHKMESLWGTASDFCASSTTRKLESQQEDHPLAFEKPLLTLQELDSEISAIKSALCSRIRELKCART